MWYYGDDIQSNPPHFLADQTKCVTCGALISKSQAIQYQDVGVHHVLTSREGRPGYECGFCWMEKVEKSRLLEAAGRVIAELPVEALLRFRTNMKIKYGIPDEEDADFWNALMDD